ncbi:sulfite exporter TauE/SafE family protein 3-like, partial [Vigna radiata var. radiata]|uniref:Sulfite exporter TauE/SafE family protein 3-like n=1 Tax=Vigna radiata var. radiata TaxID=3916 RepID=A0A3Q0EJJ4_VIGRR
SDRETFEIVRNDDEPNRVRIRAPNGLFLQAISETVVLADYQGSSWDDNDPSVFKMNVLTGSILRGEYQITNGYGPDKAPKIMQDHWKTYITEDDFKFMSENGLNGVPIAVSVTLYEAICLCNGSRVIASKEKEITDWKKLHKICLYCCCGIIAGIVSGLLGLGGGFILGPLFLELGIPPQVASATSTFAMVFSSSMSVVQYYLLERFPVPYASYFILIATIAALTGQHVVRKIIAILGRASIIIFVLAFTIFLSAISLGGVGIGNMVEKMENNEHMGFRNICHQS